MNQATSFIVHWERTILPAISGFVSGSIFTWMSIQLERDNARLATAAAAIKPAPKSSPHNL